MDRFIVPGGTGSGTSFDDGANLEDLNDQIRAAGPGGTVHLRADPGDVYEQRSPIVLTNGGEPNSPISVVGSTSDGQPGAAGIVGSRTDWMRSTDPEAITDVSGWDVGNDLFLLREGADWLKFRDMHAERVQNAWLLEAGLAGLSFGHCGGYNMRRLIEQRTQEPVTGVRILVAFVVGFSKHCIRFRGGSNDIQIGDVVLNSGRQDRDNFAMGIMLRENVHDVTIRRTKVYNCHDTVNRYHNGDGIVSDAGVRDVLIEDVACSGMTDGGFDLKGTNITLRRCRAFDNKRNIRLHNGEFLLEDVETGPIRVRGGTGTPGHITVHRQNDSYHPKVTVRRHKPKEHQGYPLYLFTAEEATVESYDLDESGLSGDVRVVQYDKGDKPSLTFDPPVSGHFNPLPEPPDKPRPPPNPPPDDPPVGDKPEPPKEPPTGGFIIEPGKDGVVGTASIAGVNIDVTLSGDPTTNGELEIYRARQLAQPKSRWRSAFDIQLLSGKLTRPMVSYLEPLDVGDNALKGNRTKFTPKPGRSTRKQTALLKHGDTVAVRHRLVVEYRKGKAFEATIRIANPSLTEG